MFRSSRRLQICRLQETCTRTLSEIYRRSRSFVIWYLASHAQLEQLMWTYIYHYLAWLPLSPHICALSNLIVSLTSHLCIIQFDCLSNLLLVPGDLEEQEQRPNLDPRRRRRLKTRQKPPDYLHLQYLTIYFPVPLRKVYLLTMVMNVPSRNYSRRLCSVFHVQKSQHMMTEMPLTSYWDEIHMRLENVLVFYWQCFGSGKFLSPYSQLIDN